jgi:hypothetical protein
MIAAEFGMISRRSVSDVFIHFVLFTIREPQWLGHELIGPPFVFTTFHSNPITAECRPFLEWHLSRVTS